MENTRDFNSEARLTAGNASLRFVDLPGMFGETLYRLPVVLRHLLENVIRNTNGDERRLAVEGIVEWLENGTSEVEIAFQPDRVLMHDTTSTPALVDIAAMRDAHGGDIDQRRRTGRVVHQHAIGLESDFDFARAIFQPFDDTFDRKPALIAIRISNHVLEQQAQHDG